MNNIFDLLFLGQQTVMPTASRGIGLILLLVAVAGVCVAGWGGIRCAVEHNYNHIGSVIVGLIMAACGLPAINFLFQPVGAPNLTSTPVGVIWILMSL